MLRNLTMNFKFFKLIAFALLIFFYLNLNLFSSEKAWEEIKINLEKIPAFYHAVEPVDIDSDGDTDLFFGNWKGFITCFENKGTLESPLFKLRSRGVEKKNSYFNIFTLNKSVPRFIDIDNDKDLDLFIGNNSGNIAFYKNIGRIGKPDFKKINSGKTKDESYFNINLNLAAAPYFFDIDNDNDYDLFAGNGMGFIAFYKNTGSPSSPEFSRVYGGKNKKDSFAGVQANYYAVPVFADIDNNGIYDLFVGDYTGAIHHYKNISSSEKYKFKLITKKFAGIDSGGDAAPVFADINNDGMDELIVGNNEGRITFYKSPFFREIVSSFLKEKDGDALLKKKSTSFASALMHRAEELIDNKEYIEALNVINKLRETTETTKELEKIARNGLKKIHNKFKGDSLLFSEAEPYFIKAVQYYIKGEYEKSIGPFSEVLYIVPNNKLSLKYKKRAQQKIKYMENETQAKGAYNKALSSYMKNDINNAYKYIKKAKELNPENSAYLERFTQYSNEHFSKINKEYYDKNFSVAEKLISGKKYKKAIIILSGLKDRFPDDKKVNDLMAWCRKRSSATQRASNKKMKEKYLKAGDKYFNKNDFKNANKNYQAALKYAPHDNRIKKKIELSRLNQEKKEKRILRPEAVKEYFQEGMKFYSMGQYEKAIFQWKKVLELDPAHVMAKKNIQKAGEMIK